MLDRGTIKKDVKGILGGESKGSVFLATLLTFIIVLVYFGAVWAVAQFFPVTQADFKAIGDYATEAYAAEQAKGVALTTGDMLNMLSTRSAEAYTAFSRVINNVGTIDMLAFVLELLIILPLFIGVQKFLLRVIRLKNPGAGTVLKGYTGSYFFRSILLPFWKGLCMLGWQLVMAILLCGMIAGIALATGLNTQSFAVTPETVNGLLSADYIAKYGWIYTIALSAWTLLNSWLMLFKRISYSLSGMALAERPQIGVRKALRASRRIARRNHFALFVVSLSYIGWYLLVGVALALVVAVGIGMNLLNLGQLGLIITLALLFIVVLLCMYLLMPYRVGVHARCYVWLKRAALEDGTVTKDDFRGKRELNAAEEG